MKKDRTGQTFELLCCAWISHNYDFHAEHNVKIKGLSGQWRQLDIAARNASNELIVGEARDHAKKISIDHVDRFVGFLEDVGAVRGILMTSGSFTRDAESRARVAKVPIDLEVIGYRDSLPPEVKYQECPAYNCYNGSIHWGAGISGDSFIRAGTCRFCGTTVIPCCVCGALNGNFDSIVGCEDCGVRYELEEDWSGVGNYRIKVLGEL